MEKGEGIALGWVSGSQPGGPSTFLREERKAGQALVADPVLLPAESRLAAQSSRRPPRMSTPQSLGWGGPTVLQRWLQGRWAQGAGVEELEPTQIRFHVLVSGSQVALAGCATFCSFCRFLTSGGFKLTVCISVNIRVALGPSWTPTLRGCGHPSVPRSPRSAPAGQQLVDSKVGKESPGRVRWAWPSGCHGTQRGRLWSTAHRLRLRTAAQQPRARPAWSCNLSPLQWSPG